MFIATIIKTQQAPEERNKISKTLRSYGALKGKEPGVYKHFIPTGLMCPRNLFKNKKAAFAKQGSRETLKVLWFCNLMRRTHSARRL